MKTTLHWVYYFVHFMILFVSLNHLINPNQKNFYHKVKYVIKRVLLMVQIAE